MRIPFYEDINLEEVNGRAEHNAYPTGHHVDWLKLAVWAAVFAIGIVFWSFVLE